MALTVKKFFENVEHKPALQQGLETVLRALQITEPLPLQMSSDQFLEWADEDTLAEWENGEVIMASPASYRHQSVERDRGTKFVEYEAAGIPEYWLIDPLRNWAEFYQLDAEGRYNPAFAGRHGLYESLVLPGFSVQVDWLWQTPLPPVLDVLKTLGVLKNDQTV